MGYHIEKLAVIEKHIFGPFDVDGDTDAFTAGDPIYDIKKNGFKVEGLLAGKWFYWVDYDRKIKRPIGIGASYCDDGVTSVSSEEIENVIGIDSASCALTLSDRFDDLDRGNMQAIAMRGERFGVYDRTVVSLSGWGDGFYPIILKKSVHNMLGVEVRFIYPSEVTGGEE